MAIKTLKIGATVVVKESKRSGVISRINEGRYQVGQSKLFYSAGDLMAVKPNPAAKQKTKIKQSSDLTIKLSTIYRSLAPRWLTHNKLCRARFAGCTHKATQVHHMFKRTGFWLIMTKFFFPICRSCHRYATDHSKEAIAAGVSISRHSDVEYDFNKLELKLIKEQNLTPPVNKVHI